MILPEPFKSKIEGEADKFSFAGDSVPPDECFRRGAEALFQLLLESGVGFDVHKVYGSIGGRPQHCHSCYEDGARWQHQILTVIYEAKLAAKDAEIKKQSEDVRELVDRIAADQKFDNEKLLKKFEAGK